MPAIGLDLSPHYLAHARRKTGRRRIAYIQANAEHPPFAAASLDIVSASYLFHELPPRARARVALAIGRVLKPGGLFLLIDTLQMGDAPALDILLESFPREFHEPYYAGYVRENLEALFAPAGLRLAETRTGFLTKVSAFRKIDS